MSRLSFALTIAALVSATVVLSAFALQSLFAPDPGNEDVAEETEERTQATETPEETTAYREETTTLETTGLQGAGNLNRPPDSTLSYGEREAIGVLGSYCWGNMCADSVFIVPPRKKTLSVPSGSEMVFRYGGQNSPDTVKAGAAPLKARTVAVGTSTASADPNRSRSLKALGSGVERTIVAELPPGEYAVEVFVIEPHGDAVYFFRIMVE
jgi:hypothetical protein